MLRQAGRKIKASLKLDRIERARKCGERIMEHLAAGDAKEAWHSLQGWYLIAGEQQSKRCHDVMEKQTLDREKLYARVAPPGDPIPCNVPAIPVNERPPENHEIRAAAQKMSNGRTGGSGGMKANEDDHRSEERRPH